MLGATTSCVLGEPDFTPPERSRPQLIAIEPPVGQISPFAKLDSQVFPTIDFTVNVLSEDNGLDLYAVLLLSYGDPSSFDPNQPYERSTSPTVVEAGTIEQGPRPITNLSYRPQLQNDTHGCDRVTLLVAHERIERGSFFECPKELHLSATLTWFFPICDNLGDCDAQDCVSENPTPIFCPEDPEVQTVQDNP